MRHDSIYGIEKIVKNSNTSSNYISNNQSYVPPPFPAPLHENKRKVIECIIENRGPNQAYFADQKFEVVNTFRIDKENGYLFRKFLVHERRKFAVKFIVIAGLVVNTLLNTNPGMNLKMHTATYVNVGLEYCIGGKNADNICITGSKVGKFISNYVDRTLTWINY
jgi:hypothetical protein